MDSRAKEDDIKFLEDDQMKEDDPSSPGTRKDVVKNLYITRESKETPGAGLSRTCSTPPSMTPVPEVEKIKESITPEHVSTTESGDNKQRWTI